VFKTRYLTFAVLICYDQWFPEAARIVALDGADLIFYPTAIGYLKGEGKFRDRSRFVYPSFITTDLKMANGDGFYVLQYLKSNPESAVIPTCVLSASADPDDIKKSYMLGASCYHVKPSSYGDLLKMMSILLEYWMLCEVPEVDVTGKRVKTQSRGKLGQRILQAD
jgi:CheY-like chemotaxis protein